MRPHESTTPSSTIFCASFREDIGASTLFSVAIDKAWNGVPTSFSAFTYEKDDTPDIDENLEKVVEQIGFEWEYDIYEFDETEITSYNVTYYDKLTGYHHVTLKKE